MEITVPDLDDVTFEELCHCQFASVFDVFPANPDGSVPDPDGKTGLVGWVA